MELTFIEWLSEIDGGRKKDSLKYWWLMYVKMEVVDRFMDSPLVYFKCMLCLSEKCECYELKNYRRTKEIVESIKRYKGLKV